MEGEKILAEREEEERSRKSKKEAKRGSFTPCCPL
jgi:hypothetical protein